MPCTKVDFNALGTPVQHVKNFVKIVMFCILCICYPIYIKMAWLRVLDFNKSCFLPEVISTFSVIVIRGAVCFIANAKEGTAVVIWLLTKRR